MFSYCRFAASGSIDGTIRVWDIVDGKEAGAFVGHTAAVWGVSYTPDGTLIASASSDKTVLRNTSQSHMPRGGGGCELNPEVRALKRKPCDREKSNPILGHEINNLTAKCVCRFGCGLWTLAQASS